MEKTADVVIIGGGGIGVSIAYHLALRRAGRILFLEKGQLGEGSTSININPPVYWGVKKERIHPRTHDHL